MIAVDTNILVYAHRQDSQWHESAYKLVDDLSQGIDPWAIPWPCIHEFLAISTHPRIYRPPSPLSKALDQVDAWIEAPNLVVLSESEGYASVLKVTLKAGKAIGPKIHDARIAALCLHHGIDKLWTADRDFGRFSKLKTENPLVS